MKKNTRNTIKLEAEEKKAIEKDAQFLGMTMSAYTRWLYALGRQIAWSLRERNVHMPPPEEEYAITKKKLRETFK